MRRAVGLLIQESASEKKDVGFGVWKHKKTDSRKFVEKLRSEWSEK